MTGAGAPKGLIVAAASSGSGKTTVTLALLRALKRAGITAVGLKAGPDFIDPAFQAAAAGRPCRNLDLWSMRPATWTAQISRAAADTDLIIVEGVMGLFDGAPGPGASGDGSTAAIAAATGWPVLLVLDCAGQAATAAAVAHGLAGFDPKVRVAGVIANQVASARHAALLTRAFDHRAPPLLGTLPRRADLGLPSRHLGLVQAGEQPDLEALLDRAATWLTDAVPLAALITLATPGAAVAPGTTAPIAPLGQRIAVARDDAFAFVYPHLLEGWRIAGAELSFFSPLADEAPDPAADAIYLPGGYPELHAGRLAANRRFLDEVRAKALAGTAIYGECGGYMCLGTRLTDGSGNDHRMLDLLPLTFSFAAPKRRLGYRRVSLLADTLFGRSGQVFRGHEFHYASVAAEPVSTALFQAEAADGSNLGPIGCRQGRIAGSFIHLVDQD